uniref:Bm10263 n=1 Tax=Brugia malayi TaxID=6279 RepID=A0A0J9XXF9_BRUMA|nr:Bm10263 [Brugia malayi]
MPEKKSVTETCDNFKNPNNPKRRAVGGSDEILRTPRSREAEMKMALLSSCQLGVRFLEAPAALPSFHFALTVFSP